MLHSPCRIQLNAAETVQSCIVLLESVAVYTAEACVYILVSAN